MSGLPPKPPRLPPGYLRRASWVIGMDLFGVLLNGWLAHDSARNGRDLMLFLNCGAVAASGAAFVVMLCRMREDLREWADLRRQWDELNEYYNGKGPQ